MKRAETIHQSTIETPLGEMAAWASSRGLGMLEFLEPHGAESMERRSGRYFPGHRQGLGESEILNQTRRWIEAYFSGERPGPVCLAREAGEGKSTRARALALDMRGTPFELRVWSALLEVAYGKTASYGELARLADCPGGARAVGGAVGRNPISLIVPCHRIIGSDGSLTGYGGGLDRKLALLELEGAG